MPTFVTVTYQVDDLEDPAWREIHKTASDLLLVDGPVSVVSMVAGDPDDWDADDGTED